MKLRRTLTSCRWIAALIAAAALVVGATAQPAAAEPEMTDQAITDKIEDELLTDPGVYPARIDVSTSDGIVTFEGQASNILAKERAARLAEAVKGVRAVVNRIQVNPSPFREDADIKSDVTDALLRDPATDSYEITVSVKDGIVALAGTVDSYKEKELVKTVVKGVHGVTDIDDDIKVNYKTDRPDFEIKNEIEQGLNWSVFVDDALIDVQVSDGNVTLTGAVGSAAEKRNAATMAWVSGVNSVDDSGLDVETWARDKKFRGDKYVFKPEDKLRDAVKDALVHDPRVWSFHVDVDVSGSAVTLRGTVDNLKAKRAAAQDARNTVGVSYVDNRLKVKMDNLPSDAEIAKQIEKALKRDPYLERFDLTATVVANTAHLYGTVDSYFEKNRADDVASGVFGVIDINNHIAMEDYDESYVYDPYVDDGYVDEDDLIFFDRRAPYKTDTEIKESINSELWWSPFVDVDQVTVTVDDGIATLTGTVNSWAERNAATENAYEGGATLVDNELTVSYD